jgi:peroxiredoxin
MPLRRWIWGRACAALLVAALLPARGALGALDGEGRELLGRLAPAWSAGHWFNTAPLALADLRGKVVLVRWFMSPRCPLCSATAPSLDRLWREYRDRGLVVVGMYHHKDPEPLTEAAVAGYLRHFGFTFPVAIDPDWRTLRRWWLDGHTRAFTSVTFLIDRGGVIRHIHPGGRLAPDSADFAELRARIEELLPPAR